MKEPINFRSAFILFAVAYRESLTEYSSGMKFSKFLHDKINIYVWLLLP